MAVGFPAKTNFATGDVLTATNVNDITGTLNLLNPAAKGVVFAASAANTPAAVTVGADGTVLTADAASAAGVKWATPASGANAFYAGKNKIINGKFDVWQRGLTNLTNFGAVGCNADRWGAYTDGTGTKTISAQTFTPGSAPVAGYESQYFMRYNQTVAGTGGTENNQFQAIEDVRTLAGQTATLSFWMKADSTRSVTPYIVQRFGSGGSSAVTNNGSAISVTTSWQRFTATFTVASISGKTIGTNSFLEVGFRLPINVVQTIDIWGVQVEAGSTATDFQTASGYVGSELALCQRYYYRNTQTSTGVAVTNNGGSLTTTLAEVVTKLPVTMRVNPTALETLSIAWYNYANVTLYSSGTWTMTSATPDFVTVRYTHGSAIFTAGQVGTITSNANPAYIGFSAEL